MKTVVVLAALVALALAGTVPKEEKFVVKTKEVDAEFALQQKKLLSLLKNVWQIDVEADYYKVGSEYDVEANIDNYTNKEAVQEFLRLYKYGFMPKFEIFSIFNDKMGEEAIALFHILYYAKDFDTFYKTAAFARVYLNEYQFVYSFYIAVIQRDDFSNFVLPAPYEIYPEMFANTDVLKKAEAVKMSAGYNKALDELAAKYGIVRENNDYIYYSNYSSTWTYSEEDSRISYFTEDIGLNTYYYFFHAYMPFWMEGNDFGPLKERRGEHYYFFYQQLLARYYLERLSNGLGEIPDFSWYYPLKNKYSPYMTLSLYPFAQRNQYYHMQTEKNVEDIQFLDTYEKTFLQYLQRGQFKAFNQEVGLQNAKAINFVGNYWQSNIDLYEKAGPRNYFRSYEMTARQLLSAAPESKEKYGVYPAALSFYQTSMRDPAFYQLYSKILKYFLQYKEYLEPYTQQEIAFSDVKVKDVSIEGNLVTYFDLFDFDISNAMLYSQEELKSKSYSIKSRQPRLNHKPFTFNIEVKSEFAGDAAFKIFMGPKYDSNGFPIDLENNWMNFVELDWFVQKLTNGDNKIERKSEDFFYFKEDSISAVDVLKLVEQNKVPVDQSSRFEDMPNRLMLPKGTASGFPLQFVVFVYPYKALDKEYKGFEPFLVDSTPFGYPFDRPIDETYFKQPNMFFKDFNVYHEGEQYPFTMANAFYVPKNNEVPKN